MTSMLVTSYVDPDLDGIAGLVGYSEFLTHRGKQNIAAYMGVLHDEARYVLDRFNIPYPQKIGDGGSFDDVVLVDVSDRAGLAGRISLEKVSEVIDHRKVHEAELFARARIQIELVGSVATLIAERYINDKLTISRNAAILLFTAIISNTLNFKSSVTTKRDQDAAYWLSSYAKLPQDFWKELFKVKSDLAGEVLAKRISGDFATFSFAEKSLGVAQLELMNAAIIKSRCQEVLEILLHEQKQRQLDLIFLTAVSLDEEKNLFLTPCKETQGVLERLYPSLIFENGIAERPGLLLRKQIVPLIMDLFKA